MNEPVDDLLESVHDKVSAHMNTLVGIQARATVSMYLRSNVRWVACQNVNDPVYSAVHNELWERLPVGRAPQSVLWDQTQWD